MLLWHGNYRYAHLFAFLAPRFLLAPDRVLDCERMHARWQWYCATKKAIEMQTRIGPLRLHHCMEHNPASPTDADIPPHLRAEISHRKMDVMAMHEDDEVPTPWLED